jgi:hypothetical protein
MSARFVVLPGIKKLNERAKRGALAATQAARANYIYVIHMHDTVYKIGQSRDPQGRRNELQSSSPYKLTLIHTFPADDPDVAEQMLHGHLHSHRLEGEWFALSPQQARTLREIDRYEGGKFFSGQQQIHLVDLARIE